jgi:cell division protein FtsI/penicillin-binding protein 2
MRSKRRYPAEAISRLNLAVESAPREDAHTLVDLELIAAPGRLVFLGLVFGLLGLLITVQLFRLQLSEKMRSIVPLEPDAAFHVYFPPRGEIYDRWGHLLAGSQLVYEVGANFVDVDSPETIAMAIADVMSDSPAYNNPDYTSDQYEMDILTKFELAEQYGWSYVLLADFVTEQQLAELTTWVTTYDRMKLEDDEGNPLNLNGLLYRQRLERVYPEGFLVENILGFVDHEGQGYYGVESRYNDLLAGVPIYTKFSVDPNRANEITQMDSGAKLVLTIDREMQAAVYDILEDALDDTGSKSGTVVVMDPMTGEILAMVSLPQVKLVPYWEKDDQEEEEITPFNRAISMTYEPGSVFKVFTMAAALDFGAVTPDTTFNDTGSITYAGVTIYNWDRGAWGLQNMQGCMQHSLNVCLTWVAIQLEAENFYRYMQDFGLGRTSGIDLAGEAPGWLRLPGDGTWYEAELAFNSFGQGVTVTPVQMLMAISSVANLRGEMMMPHLVRSTVRDGTQYTPAPVVVGHPISADTAQTLTEMLANSLENESSVAGVEGYRVAGKTGTAEVPVPGGYSETLTNASFVGWGPVDQPRFLIYVMLEHPETSPWGSVVAAPVFRDVFARLAILADLPPDEVRLSLSNP